MFKAENIKAKVIIDINDISTYIAEYKRQYQNLKKSISENLKESISKELINTNYIQITKQCQNLRLDIATLKTCLALQRFKNIIKKNLENNASPTRSDIDIMYITINIGAQLKILEEETSIVNTIDDFQYNLEQIIDIFTHIKNEIEDTEIVIEQIKLQILFFSTEIENTETIIQEIRHMF